MNDTNDTLVIDLETKKSFYDVGGRDRFDLLGISVAGVYSYNQDKFFALEEHELDVLKDLMKEAKTIIGFCINQFDYPVLKPYAPEISFEKFTTVDIFDDMVKVLGHRVKLDSVAKATLHTSKSGNGLEALEWFKQGRIEDVKKYCLDDVRITRDIYEYGKKNGHVLFDSWIDGKIRSVPVYWADNRPKSLGETIEEAFNKRLSVNIEYVSAEEDPKLGFRKERMIDIYKVKPSEIEAYCHLRQAPRNFKISRIVKASITGHSYIMPGDLQKSLF